MNLEQMSLEKKVKTAEDIFGSRIKKVKGYTPGVYYSSTLQENIKEDSNHSLVVYDLRGNGGHGSIAGEYLQRILLETYPQNWILGQVDTILQTDDIEQKPANDSMVANTVAIFSPGLNSGGRKIVFYKCTNVLPWSLTIGKYFSHELGHANDWSNNRFLSFEERINLLLQIYQRCESSDRYKSWYLESIPDEPAYEHNLTNHALHYRQASEYWAELCSMYFSGQKDSLNPKDIKIVEWVIAKSDPNFDVTGAHKKRTKLTTL
jgi:hypothetical protein